MNNSEKLTRTFTLDSCDPYDSGHKVYQKKSFTIHEGVTVLVGCNGAGKTTLLHHIKDDLKKNHIPCMSYDNLHDGGSRSVGEMLYSGNTGFGATLMTASEGEAISLNLGNFASRIRQFEYNGVTKKDKFANLFRGKEELEREEVQNIEEPERWLLFDATDSGLSIDNVLEIKDMFKAILENTSKRMFIVISANEFEMASNEDCLDVQTGEYMRFANYEDYKSLILKSRNRKNKAILNAGRKKR